jgi:type IV secretory pathway TrbL component
VTVSEDPQLIKEWLRQNSLIYSGLILVGVYMVQPFLTTASLDLSARICVVAFSVAIPLLAAPVVVNRQESFRGRQTKAVSVTITQVVAQTSAFVGVVAGFWHILWVAGASVVVTGLVAVGVHSAGYMRLEQDQAPAPPGAEEPDE